MSFQLVLGFIAALFVLISTGRHAYLALSDQDKLLSEMRRKPRYKKWSDKTLITLALILFGLAVLLFGALLYSAIIILSQ